MKGFGKGSVEMKGFGKGSVDMKGYGKGGKSQGKGKPQQPNGWSKGGKNTGGKNAGGKGKWQPPAMQQFQQGPGHGNGFAGAQPLEVGSDVQFVVSGCTDATVGKQVNGSFSRVGMNHGRPTYKKSEQVDGADVMVYYWDARDGQAVNGWWFGTSVGGDQVWAFHTKSSSQTPPTAGWKVPYEGPVDPKMTLSSNRKRPAEQQLQQQRPSQPKNEVGAEAHIVVSGCAHGTVGPIVCGSYIRIGENHGKPTYKKTEQSNGSDVLIYYWNDPKSLSFCGWWIGPQVGGEQVWAFQPSRVIATCPTSGWKVPYDGPVDPAFLVSVDRKKSAEEHKQKRQEESKKHQEEQQAAQQIWAVLKKVKSAVASNLQELEKELEEITQKELEKCGPQKTKLKEESDKAVKQAKERIEQQKEAQAKAEPLLKELETVVKAAEAEAAALQKAVTDAAVDKANSKIGDCGAFINENGSVMRAGIVPSEASDDKLTLAKLLLRINECTKLVKKTQAQKKLDGALDKFAKYDSNKDGALDRKEIASYAKGEFSVSLPAETLEMIFQMLVEQDGKGVKKDAFHRLKVQVGIAREKVTDLERKKQREARDKELQELKTQLQAKVEEVGKGVSEVEAAVQVVETLSAELAKDSKTSTSTETLKKLDEVGEKSKAAKELMTSKKGRLAGLKEGLAEDVLGWLKGQTKPVHLKLVKLDKALAHHGGKNARIRGAIEKKAAAELATAARLSVSMLKYHQKVKSLSTEDLFEAMSTAKGKDRVLDKSGFISFFEKCEKEEKREETEKKPLPSAEELESVFAKWAESEATLSKERLVALLRCFMKVVKGTVITDGVSIKDSKPLRKLEVGEVIELLGQPVAEGDVDIMRVKGRAMKDDAEGFVTISGNQGTVFLQDGGNIFKVVKETILTESFELEADSKEATQKLQDTTRKLRPGELVEVQAWPKKEEKSALTRMQCKALSDGSVGWATVVGNQGTVFLEVK
mmetsp:Transcript_33066/g.53190  ORF Transcript_33066/g.53190 Transcript_33066/m.53190 type:complete len:982 (+) Transcript_33066:82-3027(+)